MNSALKPILAQAGVPQQGGQASPAKGTVAGTAHAGHPQGAQSPHAPAAAAPAAAGPANNLVQNLVQHPPSAAPLPPHAAPHMAPVSADMAQMAQNMSHHGNLSHVSQNSVTPANTAASPSKSATTSAPLSLVADKPTPSQPLALTRTPEKKEAESTSQANGTVESPKPAANAPAPIKPQNHDTNNKDKEPPKTPAKPTENAAKPPITPQKTEAANAVGKADGPAQAKVAAGSEPPEKSPSKPIEPKPVPTADVAPVQNDIKIPETANDKSDKTPEKAAVAPAPKTESKPESANAEKPKTESPAKPEHKKPEPKPSPAEKLQKPASVAQEPKKVETKPIDSTDGPKKDSKGQEKVETKVEEKKLADTPKAAKPEAKAPKSTLKLATVNTPIRKRRQASPTKAADGPSPAKKAAESDGTPDNRTKRNRTQVQLYQSPTPELAMATKLSAATGRATPPKQNDDKLIVFYKNEYLAVRNAEGGFYVCQAMQNVYRSSRRIKIRWLSQDGSDPKGETYKPDFYDVTDMECVLTTLSLTKAPGGGGAQILKAAEEARARSILERALKAETGERPKLELTEEHPDGLDLSLYKDESQLDKKGKRKSAKSSPRAKSDAGDSPVSTPPKRSPRGRTQAPVTEPAPARKPPGSKAPSKTAVQDKPSPKAKTPAKRTAKQAKLTPVKSEPPAKTPAKGRRAAKESKPSPAPTPSTSTGKATRTPRRPPHHK